MDLVYAVFCINSEAYVRVGVREGALRLYGLSRIDGVVLPELSHTFSGTQTNQFFGAKLGYVYGLNDYLLIGAEYDETDDENGNGVTGEDGVGRCRLICAPPSDSTCFGHSGGGPGCVSIPIISFTDGEKRTASLISSGMPTGDMLTMGGAVGIVMALSALGKKRPRNKE
ncbi:MAG: hypothetical protein GWP08_07995 [Nitrospiraceae bacterium]|nr:hypothetical protein [Nitrospiraceae bacterium]